MNSNFFKRSLSDAELEVLMRPHADHFMKKVVHRKNNCGSSETNKAGNGENSQPNSGASDKSEEYSLTPQEKEYLESIFEFPFLTITGRADQQGLSPYMNDKIKKSLLQNNLIEEFSANFGQATKGNVKFLLLQKAGYQAINQPMPKEKELTCSLEHWFYQKGAYAFYISKGYKSAIEWSLNGKRADVGIEKNGQVIALEFELTAKNAVSNVVKDLEAGFSRVLLACKNTKVRTSVMNKLEHALTQDQLSQVKVLLLQDLQFMKDILGKTKP